MVIPAFFDVRRGLTAEHCGCTAPFEFLARQPRTLVPIDTDLPGCALILDRFRQVFRAHDWRGTSASCVQIKVDNTVYEVGADLVVKLWLSVVQGTEAPNLRPLHTLMNRDLISTMPGIVTQLYWASELRPCRASAYQSNDFFGVDGMRQVHATGGFLHPPLPGTDLPRSPTEPFTGPNASSDRVEFYRRLVTATCVWACVGKFLPIEYITGLISYVNASLAATDRSHVIAVGNDAGSRLAAAGLAWDSECDKQNMRMHALAHSLISALDQFRLSMSTQKPVVGPRTTAVDHAVWAFGRLLRSFNNSYPSTAFESDIQATITTESTNSVLCNLRYLSGDIVAMRRVTQTEDPGRVSIHACVGVPVTAMFTGATCEPELIYRIPVVERDRTIVYGVCRDNILPTSQFRALGRNATYYNALQVLEATDPSTSAIAAAVVLTQAASPSSFAPRAGSYSRVLHTILRYCSMLAPVNSAARPREAALCRMVVKHLWSVAVNDHHASSELRLTGKGAVSTLSRLCGAAVCVLLDDAAVVKGSLHIDMVIMAMFNDVCENTSDPLLMHHYALALGLRIEGAPPAPPVPRRTLQNHAMVTKWTGVEVQSGRRGPWAGVTVPQYRIAVSLFLACLYPMGDPDARLKWTPRIHQDYFADFMDGVSAQQVREFIIAHQR